MANNFELLLDADAFLPDATNPPLLEVVQDRPYWSFDDTTDEILRSKPIACPDAYSGSGTLKIDIFYIMASATANAVSWGVQVEAVTEADATDLDAGESFDTANYLSDTVPGTAGYLGIATVTLTNKDSITDNDYVRLKVFRDADGSGATDSATGDARLLAVRLREEA
jgi:hypothetical protein